MIIAFTGAGISKASGVPTFDEMGDLRTKLERHFATHNPKEFSEIMNSLNEVCEKAEPNDAHYALAEFDIPVITMNIDSLHCKAGTKHLLEVHGSLRNNDVVLYGDSAPLYEEAYDWVDKLQEDDILLIIGTSFYTAFSSQLNDIAIKNGTKVVIINSDAEHKVREFLNNNSNKIGDFETFIERQPQWIKTFLPYAY